MRKKITTGRRTRAIRVDRGSVWTGGGKVRVVSVDELYAMCKGNPSLINDLFESIDGALAKYGLGLYEACYRNLVRFIEMHKQSEYYDQIKKAIEAGSWRKLPKYGNKVTMKPPCPWGGCPPI